VSAFRVTTVPVQEMILGAEKLGRAFEEITEGSFIVQAKIASYDNLRVSSQ